MLPVKPTLEVQPADRATVSNALHFGSCCRITSPKIQELQAKYEAAYATGYDCKNCLMRRVDGTDLVECLMEIVRCQWTTLSGDALYCKHPSATQFCSVY